MASWWTWAYWICPNAWTLKGVIISQYGDIKQEITVQGERQAVNVFLKDFYGYRHKDLPVITIMLFAYPLFFALVFALANAKLNFQKR